MIKFISLLLFATSSNFLYFFSPEDCSVRTAVFMVTSLIAFLAVLESVLLEESQKEE